MEIIEIKEKPPQESTPLTLVIGKFDGVHKGHQYILQTARELTVGTLAVMGFSEHPSWVLKQDPQFQKNITPEPEKLQLLEKYGVERYYRIHFTKEYANISAEEFVGEHLSRLNIKRIVVGEGFRFGNNGAGSAEDLIRLCEPQNIKVTVVPIVKSNGVKISSSTIRALVNEGLMEPIHSLLGRPFTITGTVIHGEKLGRTLGFPTINLGEIDEYVVPKPGVYLGSVGFHSASGSLEYWNTLISAGYRPTVNGQGYLIEAYLLNYSGDLYDKRVSVSFLHYMRGEIKFTDLDSLVKQMEQDKLDAKKLMGI